MKKLIILCLFVLLFAGCKKDNSVDPREQYIGAYNITTTQQATGTNGAKTTDVYKFNLEVSKGSRANELIFNSESTTYTAVLNGNAFEVPVYTSPVSLNGSIYAVKTLGNGSFSGSSINLNTVASTAINGVTITITKAGNGPKYK